MSGKKTKKGSAIRQVLIIEDEKDFLETLAGAIESPQLVAHKASTKKAAVLILKSNKIDVALIDICLGENSGIDVLNYIKKAYSDTICIMMTAYAEADDAIAALQQGAYDYLRKPFAVDDLLSTLNRCFEKTALKEERELAKKSLEVRNIELENINRRLDRFIKSFRKIATSSTIEEVAQSLLNDFSDSMQARGGSIFLREENFYQRIYSIDTGHTPDKLEIPLKPGSLLKKVILRKEPLLINEFSKEKKLIGSGWEGYENDSALILPLIDSRGEVYGLISLHNKYMSNFTEEDREVGAVLASYSSEVFRTFRMLSKLNERDEVFRAITGSAKDAIIMIDSEGRIAYWNKAAENIYGYKGKEAIGAFAYEILAPREKRLKYKKNILSIGRKGKSEIVGKTGTYLALRKSGESFTVEASYSAVLIQNEWHAIAIVRDISDRQIAEEALRLSEEKYRTIFEHFQDLYYQADANGILTVVSPSVKAMGGYEPEELLGRLAADIYYSSEDRDRFIKEIQAKGEVNNYEMKLLAKNGQPKDVLLNSRLIFDEEGNYTGIEGVLRDISGRKKAAEALKKSEERLRSLQENIPVGIFRSTPDGKLLTVNKAMVDMHGYSSEEEIQKVNTADLYSSSDNRQNFLEMLKKDGEAINFETDLKRKDNSTFHASINARAIEDDGKIIHIDGIIKDIDQRKAAEKALVESERKYRYYIEHISDGIWCFEPAEPIDLNLPIEEILEICFKAVCVECNENYAKMYSVTRGDLLGKRLEDIMPKDSENLDYLRSFFENDCRIDDAETYEPDFLGNDKWYLNSMFGELENNCLLLAWGRQSDITNRKLTEIALQKSELRLAGFLESATDIVLLWDSEMKLVDINKAALQLFSFDGDKEKLKGKRFLSLFKGSMVANKYKEYKTVTATGKPRLFDNITVGKPPNERIIQLRVFKVGDGLGMIGTDVTFQKKTEQELNKIQKLESLGVLAGGIAHDFNNILAALLSNVSLAKRYTKTSDKAYEKLVESEIAIEQATNLTQQLLTFSKGGSPVKETSDIVDLINDTVRFVLRGTKVKFKLTFYGTIWPVDIDKGQISQAINNIILNSVQAMPGGGQIEIFINNIKKKESVKKDFVAGEYILIQIKDEGIGIPENLLGSIFDPYFTTKEKGSGLGLASTHSIVINHDGYIEVESKPDKGAVFNIYLPAACGKEVVRIPEEEEIIADEGTILLMDDDYMVLEAAKDLLEFIGYNVIEARDGEEAVKKYEEQKDSKNPIDAVILDLTVPGGMGGRETVQKLLEIDSNVIAIATSGYSTDPILSDYETYGFKRGISKPYSLEQLSRILREVLNNK